MKGMKRRRWVIAVIFAFLAAGVGAQAPKDYRAVIAEIDNYHRFDKDRRDTLRQAGDKAAALLFPLIERRLQGGKRSAADLHKPVDALCECATIKQTDKIRALYHRIKDPATRDRLVAWMGQVGDARACRDILEARLLQELAGQAPKFRMSGGARPRDLVIGLVRSADPCSIGLLIKTLTDSRATDSIRGSVFQNLAATGDPAAIQAVRAASAGSRQRAALPFVASLDFKTSYRPPPVKGTHVDGAGTEWGLVQWDALGSLDDLWLVRKQGSHWVKPIYTGVNAYWDTPEFGAVSRTEANADREAHRSLIEGGGWVKAFIGNKALELDSDGDGLTDVAEKRFALDPQERDTDGDGLIDSLDKSPHTPRGTLSEKQQILKAAIDAMVVGRSSQRLAFFELPADVKPFEVTSWNGVVLPKALQSKFITGSRIRVGLPFQYGWATKGVVPPAFQFSKDRKTVQVLVSEGVKSSVVTSIVTLKRFKEDWIPIGVELFSHIDS